MKDSKISNRRILIICESIDVNDSSGSKGRVALIRNLADSGYHLKLFHYSGKQIELEGIPSILIKENTFSINYVMSRIQRILMRVFHINIGNIVESVFGFSFTFFNDTRSMARGLRKENPEDYDMVMTFSKGNSYRTHKALLKLPQWHAKWFAYVHDPYPQQLYPRPFNYVPRGYRSKRLFFKQVISNSYRVILPSLLLKEWLQSYYSPLRTKSLIIPHQIQDLEVVKEDLDNSFNTNNFNLVHAGNLLGLRKPNILIKAFKNFLIEQPEAKENARLILIGNHGGYQSYLREEQVNMPQLEISSGLLAFKQAYAMQYYASANIILEAQGEISPFLPGKFPHCVKANKPILLIGPYYSECRRLLGNKYPYKHDFDEVDGIAKSIGILYKKWKQTPQALDLNRDDLRRYLGKEHLIDILNTADE